MDNQRYINESGLLVEFQYIANKHIARNDICVFTLYKEISKVDLELYGSLRTQIFKPGYFSKYNARTDRRMTCLNEVIEDLIEGGRE